MMIYDMVYCCIRSGPDQERILDDVPREDGARNSLRRGVGQVAHTLNNLQLEYIGVLLCRVCSNCIYN